MAVQFDITDHAVERYIERHAQHLPYAKAKEQLAAALSEASPIKSKSINGQSLWKGASRLVVVTKNDGGKIVVVTVLPQGAIELTARVSEYDADAVVAAYERVKDLVEGNASAAAKQVIAEFNASLKNTHKGFVDFQQQIQRLRSTRAALVNDIEQLIGLDAKIAGEIKRDSLRERISSLETALANRKAENELLLKRIEKLEKNIVTLGKAPSGEESLARKYARQLEHAKRMSDERNDAQLALAIVLRETMSIISDAAHEKLEALSPEFLRREFWDREISVDRPRRRRQPRQ